MATPIDCHLTPQREQITKGRLQAQIQVQSVEKDKACIFCPAQVSEILYQHLANRHVSSSLPRRAIFGRYPQHELIVQLSLEATMAEVREFIRGLPDVC